MVETWPLLDSRAYAVWCAAVVAYVASVFYQSMLEQTGGEWSAPLDDVFIHFDYARSTARGHPFEWSPGNGYSSGNTSITYPFVLAIGWLVGFRDMSLMQWAAGVAGVSMLVFFIAAARYTRPLGPWAKYFLPPAVMSLGALDWSLFSGMENAFHLGVWGLASMAFDRFERVRADAKQALRAAVVLGLAGALLVLTRPESAVCVVVFTFAALWLARGLGPVRALSAGALIAIIPVAALAVFAFANRVFTGEWSQAGAIAKLALHHPYMDRDAKYEDWIFNLKYVLTRMAHHHFADESPMVEGQRPFGYIVPLLALVPLAHKKLRLRAAMLWVQIATWTMVVALNGQVRWQNERYVMSGVAWMLLLSGMGVATLASHYGESLRGRISWAVRSGVAALAVMLFWHHQHPNTRDQIWFFSRASRNIRDQQIEAGRRLKTLTDPKPTRVLVGDAGAITYASDLPGLDIIGLGGYREYPFARATKYGLGSAIELIERMEEGERPNYMAIYPGWWGDLPIIFGRYVTEVPVVGNVICGGASKVIYRSEWGPLERASYPRSMTDDETIVGELDTADLLSERPQGYEHPPHIGFVTWRVLPDPDEKGRDLFDAGRIIPPGYRESFRLPMPAGGGRLIVRTVATKVATVRVLVEGQDLGVITIAPSETWVEPSIDIPPGFPSKSCVELVAEEGEWVDHHVWTIAKP
ncbi:MAG: hypothetical protein HOW73_27570 [Polyangiaceae bacterium]|nr:hypothetical protein [Polyangiaceae bacterium]